MSFFKCGPPVVGSLFFQSPSMIYISQQKLLLMLHKYCQMAPLHKIDASNDSSASFLPWVVSTMLCNSFHNTRTSQKELNIILWRLLLVSSFALTDTMSESVPFFFCSDFHEVFIVDSNSNFFLAALRFEPLNIPI